MCRIRSLTRRQKHVRAAITALISTQTFSATSFFRYFFLLFSFSLFFFISGVCPGLRCFPSKHSGARAAEARVHCGNVTSRPFFSVSVPLSPSSGFRTPHCSFTPINQHYVHLSILKFKGVFLLVLNHSRFHFFVHTLSYF